MTPVERVRLTPELDISRVITGLWQLADMERDGRAFDRAAASLAMRAYADAGLTTFDMADHYGSAEAVAGAFRASLPDPASVQLFTKWVPDPGVGSKDQVRRAVLRALERLRTERLDLLQFHAWNYAHPEWLDCLFWLDELRAEGLIGELGLTNFDTAHLRVALASGVAVRTNQVSFSLLDRRAAGRMTELCREHGVGLLAYGTVAGGFLSERWLGRPEPDWERLDTWSEMKYGRFLRSAGGWDRFQAVLKVVKAIADRRGVSMANVACRFVLEEPAVAGVIIGARLSERDHIADNLRVFSFRLDPADRDELETVLGGLERIPGDCGDEYRKPPFLTASGDLSHHLTELPAPFRVEAGADGRRRALSGTTWETMAGYCRAVRVGSTVLVSGTTATHGARLLGGTDPAAQFHAAVDKIEGALQSLGAALSDVVRTRVFVRNVADWEAVARAHGERFAAIRPANTLVEARLVGAEYLVEVEAEARLPESREGSRA